MVNLTFLLEFQTVALTILLLWINFFLLTLYFRVAFPPLGNSDRVAVSFSIDFPINAKKDDLFHCVAYNYFLANWDGLCDHFKDVIWEDIFKLSASAASSESCDWVQVGIDVYIPHHNYQVKITHLHRFQQLVLLP